MKKTKCCGWWKLPGKWAIYKNGDQSAQIWLGYAVVLKCECENISFLEAIGQTARIKDTFLKFKNAL